MSKNISRIVSLAIGCAVIVISSYAYALVSYESVDLLFGAKYDVRGTPGIQYTIITVGL